MYIYIYAIEFHNIREENMAQQQATVFVQYSYYPVNTVR